jgi:hypothetical protein
MATRKTSEVAPGDRYIYDFGLCSSKRGWAQLDTRQDAAYYGNWVNPHKRATFSFCEGDTTLVECDTDEEFVSHVRSVVDWHAQQDGAPAKIDGMCDPDLIAAFERLGLSDILH